MTAALLSLSLFVQGFIAIAGAQPGRGDRFGGHHLGGEMIKAVHADLYSCTSDDEFVFGPVACGSKVVMTFNCYREDFETKFRFVVTGTLVASKFSKCEMPVFAPESFAPQLEYK